MSATDAPPESVRSPEPVRDPEPALPDPALDHAPEPPLDDASRDLSREVPRDASPAGPAEPSMVQQRSRRSNAGSRMRSLLDAAGSAQPAQGDEWYNHEAFAEDAEDDEFGGVDPDDAHGLDDELVSSSSDDEDPQDQDEDAGEKVLQKEERRLKLKRKRPGLIEQAAMKKAKVATAKAAASTAGSMAPPPKPKKKSERVSWLPTENEGPVRSSSRNLTLQNKQNVVNSLQQKEANRIRILKMMEASNVRKERDRPQGPLTQEQRLAEAAKVERQNAKTVSRWEESERLREEEQKAKLEALKNRKLDGPFIRYYSGPSIWVNDKIKGVGAKKCQIGYVEEDARRDSHAEVEGENEDPQIPMEDSASTPIPHTIDPATGNAMAGGSPSVEPPQNADTPASGSYSKPSQAHDHSHLPTTEPPDPALPNIMFPQPRPSFGFLDGIEDWAAFPHPHSTNSAPESTHGAPYHDTTQPQSEQVPATSSELPPAVLPQAQPATLPPTEIETITLAVRNLLTLQNIPNLKPRDRDALTRALFPYLPSSIHIPKPSRTTTRGSKSSAQNQELCTITSLPARYRDPVTGLAYHDAYAYKCLRRFVDQGTAGWSELLGCFVGPKGDGRWSRASGVPEGWFGEPRSERSVEHVEQASAGAASGEVKVEG